MLKFILICIFGSFAFSQTDNTIFNFNMLQKFGFYNFSIKNSDVSIKLNSGNHLTYISIETDSTLNKTIEIDKVLSKEIVLRVLKEFNKKYLREVKPNSSSILKVELMTWDFPTEKKKSKIKNYSISYSEKVPEFYSYIFDKILIQVKSKKQIMYKR